MKYSEAKEIGNKSLSGLIVEKLLSDESIGKSISSSIAQKLSAKRTRIKEKFDPLNIVKFLSGGSSLGPALIGRIMGRSKEDIHHFAGSKISSRSKDPLYAHINSNSIVPLKVNDGSADIVTKIYVLLKKSHDRKKREELAFIKQERKIRRDSDNNLKSMINGLISVSNGSDTAGKTGGEGNGGFGWEKFAGLGLGVLGAGAKVLGAGGRAGRTLGNRARKKLDKARDRLNKVKKTFKDRLYGKKPPAVEESLVPEQKTKTQQETEKSKTDKGTKKTIKQKKVPTRGSERFRNRQKQPETVQTTESKKTTSEKVTESSNKVSKSLRRVGRVFAAVGLVLLVDELNELYKKNQSGQLSDEETKKELIKITAGALGGTGGAALGAMLGSLVAPIAGTIVGGIAGGIGGGLFAEEAATKAIDFFENNDVPTSPVELQNMAKKYAKEHGGDSWGTNESISQWFQKNTIGRAKQFVSESGGEWGVDMSWGDWTKEQIVNIKNYIDKSVAEQLSVTPQYNSRYNDVMSQNERLSIDSITNAPVINTNNNFNTNVRGSESFQFNGEQKVRNDSLLNYR